MGVTTALNFALGRIKNKLQLSKIVAMDIPLQKKGREFVGNCPFHNEKTGSFFVNDDKGTFYCFGCGASGDILEYIMKKNGLHFMQALEKLADLSGIKLPEKDNLKIKHNNNYQKILQKASEYYKKSLNSNKEVLEYCKSREIDFDIIERFSIGFSPYNGYELFNILKQDGFLEDDIFSSGLFIKQNNKSFIARFRDRLMFPVFDNRGWPIAFGARSLKKGIMPKYLNSPETDYFQKKDVLYGYNIASKNINKENSLILVEGYIDVLMMHKYGFNTASASMGTSFSTENLTRIWKYSDYPIICFDGDLAGYNAMLKLANLALNYLQPGKSLRFCMIPNGLDPDSFLKENGKVKMDELINKSLYLIDFLWKKFLDDFEKISNKTPEKIAFWKKEIYNISDSISNLDIKKLYNIEYNRRISQRLKEYFPKVSKDKKQYSLPLNNIFSIDKKEKILLRESILLYTILVRPCVIFSVIEELSIIEFSDKSFKELRDKILENPWDFKESVSSLKEVIENIEVMASKSINIKEMKDKEVVDFWHNVFEFGFSKKARYSDLLLAKKECDEDFTHSKWERLKALKMDSILKIKKDI